MTHLHTHTHIHTYILTKWDKQIGWESNSSLPLLHNFCGGLRPTHLSTARLQSKAGIIIKNSEQLIQNGLFVQTRSKYKLKGNKPVQLKSLLFKKMSFKKNNRRMQPLNKNMVSVHFYKLTAINKWRQNKAIHPNNLSIYNHGKRIRIKSVVIYKCI